MQRQHWLSVQLLDQQLAEQFPAPGTSRGIALAQRHDQLPQQARDMHHAIDSRQARAYVLAHKQTVRLQRNRHHQPMRYPGAQPDGRRGRHQPLPALRFHSQQATVGVNQMPLRMPMLRHHMTGRIMNRHTGYRQPVRVLIQRVTALFRREKAHLAPCPYR